MKHLKVSNPMVGSIPKLCSGAACTNGTFSGKMGKRGLISTRHHHLRSMHISGSRSILSTPELWPSSKSKTVAQGKNVRMAVQIN